MGIKLKISCFLHKTYCRYSLISTHNIPLYGELIKIISHHNIHCRVAMVREKSLENEKFSRSGKNQGISFLTGKFRKNDESQGKVI